MARQLEDWLKSYMEYTAYNESPDLFHFWCGVSAVAGVLQRHVYFDQFYYRWYPNFYIVLSAPSGVVSKTIAIGNAMKLLRKVPGIHMGPDVLTWQSLIPALEEAREEIDGQSISCLTFESDELGALLDTNDRGMVNMLTKLWDGKDSMDKMTKQEGHSLIANPWVNILAGTTPSWAGANLKAIMDWGLPSRCIFVFADEKRRLISYPARRIPPNLDKLREQLIHDLEDISLLQGPFTLTEEAYTFGDVWYEDLYKEQKTKLAGMFDGYISRKQGHVHKIAMVLSAAKRSNLVIEKTELETAAKLATMIEPEMNKAFGYMGTDIVADKINDLMRIMKANKRLTKQALYRLLFSRTAMGYKEFSAALESGLASGLLVQEVSPNSNIILFVEDKPNPPA